MSNPFLDAEQKIAGILKALEIETGEVIESIELAGIEVTTIGDDRRMFQQQVHIFSHRLPGHCW